MRSGCGHPVQRYPQLYHPSESMHPGEIVILLNAYFSCMAACVTQAGGWSTSTCDGMMALFESRGRSSTRRQGPGVCQPDAARTLRPSTPNGEHWASSHRGNGLHGGKVLAGNIGSAERLSIPLSGMPSTPPHEWRDYQGFGARIVFSEEILRRLDTPENFPGAWESACQGPQRIPRRF